MAAAEITMELGRPRSRGRRWFVAILFSLVVLVAAAWVAQRLLLTSPTARQAVAFSAGPFHTCAIQRTKVVCWGNNDHRQLGLRGAAKSAAPISVPGLRDVTQISAGYQHTCALHTSGEVACWGSGSTGSLGNGKLDDSAVPVTVMGLHDATSVSAGDSRSCAVRTVGRVVCWGLGVFGPAGGDGREIRGASSRPVAITRLDDVTSVSVGDDSACALRAAGDVRCWGGNNQGQLGDGTLEDSGVPVRVKGIAHATQITVGGDFACALQGGRELCWGGGYDGNLGDGNNRNSSRPVLVQGLRGVTQISGTCALRAGVGVACWGNNSGGLTTSHRGENAYSPVKINGLDDAVALSSGGIHACAVIGSGSMVCWGDNEYDELGLGRPVQEAQGTAI
jgi:alpha-tubulin suppressor-like RCC1 family protein